jgi:hypothetical protein
MKKATVGKGRRDEGGRETCAFCGKVNNTPGFFIGASLKAAWVMVEGTGKMTCPECWEKATREGQEAINRHVETVNRINKGIETVVKIN